jgi:hypothetical protein
MHGRTGQGVPIVLDVVPTQDVSVGNAGRGLGHISHYEAAHLFGNL